MRISVDGDLPFGVTAKDVILAIIGQIGTAGGTGHVIEYAGEVVRGLSMAGRMTVCNMSIEAGARAGLIAPDETTFRYVQGRPMAPKAGAFEQAVAHWRTLPSDAGARYDKEVTLDAAGDRAAGHLGHEPAGRPADHRQGPRPQTRERSGAAGGDGAGARVHGPRARHADQPRSRSTRCSSAPAPTPGSRTCAPPPR